MSEIEVNTAQNLEANAAVSDGKKRKKKYTRALAGPQKMERTVVKAQRRMAKAVLEGLDTWQKKRDKSAYKNRDGAMRDAMKNSAKAMGKVVRVSSRIPADMLNGMRPRKAMRLFFPPAWFIR